MNQDWEKDYSNYKKHYKSFQKEVYSLVIDLTGQHEKVIHMVSIKQRDGNEPKSKKSIKNNLNEARLDAKHKYNKHKSIFDIKDIAGVRVTCHCENDVENLSIFLFGELRQKYSNVERKDIGGKGSVYPYRGTHLTFTKSIKENKKTSQIFCEIQIRTVMADAWAVQNHKYLYKKIKEGEAHELTSAVSEIMNGCEKLWSLVKKKSIEKEKDNYSKEIFKIRKEATKGLQLISKDKKQIKMLSNWFISNKTKASKQLKDLGIKTFMEVEIKIPSLDLDIAKKILKDGARNSTIRTFGWPIGIFFDNRSEFTPRPDPDGIHAEIAIKEKDQMDPEKKRITYDYWAIHSSGAFYLLKSLFEGERRPNQIFFNTRIVRITEVFMYIKNLYLFFEIPSNTEIEVMIKHGGLKGKILGSSSQGRSLFGNYKIDTDEVSTIIKTTLDEIESDLVNVVEQFTKPLFEQFEFFELERKVLEDIVVNYLNGKVV